MFSDSVGYYEFHDLSNELKNFSLQLAGIKNLKMAQMLYGYVFP